jgi:NAD/NADP transhydrogenase alpha subunit
VVVDMATDQGGNCELTEAGQVVDRHRRSSVLWYSLNLDPPNC